ncbi:acVLRF1 family peptidyl-tRNA hydrolase [Serinicoccus kebangsaanensis]|uniref:acVLRF1 family peptidyl-tRNA hydrolase n=1 Tax=Serinicoccus kebangsaanensis TaxID=2602069 RepID=UPI00124EF972|nr:acVLRF1 family peptidyl-tRNA hydrolase [Serinicoccus kebangsaanensis]
MSRTRRVEVAPERLPGWVERFAASHGEVSRSLDPGTDPASWQVEAADGSWARLTGWRDAVRSGPDDPGWPPASWLRPPPLLVVLVRRGGYAVAVAAPDGTLVAHKVGTRHVQSRTAAGGWSQQRYARRRGNQADALVQAVTGHTVRLLLVPEADDLRRDLGGVVLGGDKALAAEVLAGVRQDAALPQDLRTELSGLPRRELWDLPDPRRAVLEDAVRRGRAVQVEVHNA